MPSSATERRRRDARSVAAVHAEGLTLFWLTFDTQTGTEVFIAEADFLAMARVKAGLAGQRGAFQEGHQLDAKTARKIPRQAIGRTLTQAEALALLRRMS